MIGYHRTMGRQIVAQTTYKGVVFQIVQGDIVRQPSETIVNAANESLLHGGGVAGAVSAAGGPELDHQSRNYVKKHGRVKTGTVAITGPGRMRYKFVIHAVGPIYRGKQSDSQKLFSATINSFIAAEQNQASSISIPAISSGIFGFPKDKCAVLMIQAAIKFVDQHKPQIVKTICFSNFDTPTVSVFERAFKNFVQRIEVGSKEEGLEAKQEQEEQKTRISEWEEQKKVQEERKIGEQSIDETSQQGEEGNFVQVVEQMENDDQMDLDDDSTQPLN